ncbi:MAG: WbqC family protein [Nitrospirota bacterium]|nr:MAG: WbqC family protein [Nitrospirota bacterium]
MKRIAIIQPGYLPWLGYFEQIIRSDVFVYLDDVQFTKSDWRNRNRIKTKDGVQWLTVPVVSDFGKHINQTVIADRSKWQRKHLQALRTWYNKARYFEDYFDEVGALISKQWKYISDLDIGLTDWIIDKLSLDVKVHISSDLQVKEVDKQLRIIEICNRLGCDHFYEGKKGMDYIDTSLFDRNGITVEFQDYAHPVYDQLWAKEQGFISHLSVIDLLLNHGKESADIIALRRIVDKVSQIEVKHADSV